MNVDYYQSENGVYVLDVEGTLLALPFDDPQDRRAIRESAADVNTFLLKHGNAFVYADFANSAILVTNRIDFDTAGKAAKISARDFSSQQVTNSALFILEKYTELAKTLMGKEYYLERERALADVDDIPPDKE